MIGEKILFIMMIGTLAAIGIAALKNWDKIKGDLF